jgi:hypothetical protein
MRGVHAAVDIIPGHRDWAPTQCPGNTFYPALATLRHDVAAMTGRQLINTVQ